MNHEAKKKMKTNGRVSSFSAISTLVGGTGGAQALTILSLPILSRIYQPGDFGVLGVFAAVLAITVSLSGFSYELAIPISDNKKEAKKLLKLACYAAIPVAFSVALFAIFIGEDLSSSMGEAYSKEYLFILSVGCLLSAFYKANVNYALYLKDYKSVALSKISQSLSSIFVRIFVGLFYSGPLGLLLGAVLASGGGIMAFRRNFIDRRKGNSANKISILSLARKYKKFAFYSTPANLLNTVSTNIPIVLLGLYYKSWEVGLVALAIRVGMAPTMLIGMAVRQVYYSESREAFDKGGLGELTGVYARALAKVVIAPALIVGYFLPDLFSIFFGRQWSGAGTILFIMLPWILIQFITAQLASTTYTTGNQRGALIFQVFFLFVRISAVSIGVLFGGIYFSILMLSLGSFICYLLFSVWVFSIVGADTSRFIFVLMKETVLGLLFMAVFVLAGYFLGGELLKASMVIFSVGVALFLFVVNLKKAKITLSGVAH